MNLLMNKLATALVLAGMMAGASPALLAASDVVADCKSLRDLDSYFDADFGNLGQCISFFRTQPADACQLLKEMGLLENFGYANQGECVVDLLSN